MKIIETPQFQASDGTTHTALNACCEHEVRLGLIRLSAADTSSSREMDIITTLSENWLKLHTLLLSINGERVHIANQIGE